jgi:FkbM family methyltransferase
MSSTAPAVSVILPTRNRRQMLQRAIDSVLQQTFGDFELIVVDDASTDDTKALLDSIADPRLRQVHLDHHAGPARARNAGIRAARAPLLAFQDSDDEWLPRKLEQQVALMRASPADVGLVSGAFLLVEPERQREVRSPALERGTDYGLDIIQGVPLVTPLWLVRRSAIEAAGLFDESLASSEDYELAFRLSRVCRFRAVPERVLVKTGHAGSLTTDNRLLLRGLELVYARYREFWRPYPDEEVRTLLRIAALHQRVGSRRGAARAQLRALARRPWRPSLLRRLLVTLFGRGALKAYAQRARQWIARRGAERRLRGPRAMAAFGRSYPRATFVQIGSNDGDKHDPLRQTLLRHSWSGVMVEPVPYVFARLRRNYGNFPGVRLENMAVAASPEPATLPFYYVAEAPATELDLPSWYDELGSFRKEVVLSHAAQVPDLEKRLVTIQVPCVTLEALCRRNGLAAVDLLHMDTEGYDAELLAAMDFRGLRPVLLIYEHKHLGEARRRQCQELLRGHGYALFEEDQDTWCVDVRARDAAHRRFLRAWKRIAPDQPDSIHS